MSRGVRLRITNTIANDGDYTAAIKVGSQDTPLNVLLDTGSSGFAVHPDRFDPASDRKLQSTPFAQRISYDDGSYWAGPVVRTELGVGPEQIEDQVEVDTFMTLAYARSRNVFGGGDGLLGLAYQQINDAFDLTERFSRAGRTPLTYPWPFPRRTSYRQFCLHVQRMSTFELEPYSIALLHQSRLMTDRFGFVTHRSSPRCLFKDPRRDSLNHGWLVIGNDPARDLHHGDFKDAKIVHDSDYDVKLLSVRVGGCRAVRANQVPAVKGSNACVDSGTNVLSLTPELLTGIVRAFRHCHYRLASLFELGLGSYPQASELDLEEWPDITFTLEGEDGLPIDLVCKPDTYWQLHAPRKGQANLAIVKETTGQSILGLPLMNNYYTVFDLTRGRFGSVRFATLK